MIYISSPYSDPDKQIMQYRYKEVLEFMRFLIRQKTSPISVVAMCHPLQLKGTDQAFWKAYYTPILEASEKVAVLMLSGWQSSTGVLDELDTARTLNKSIDFYSISEGAYQKVQRTYTYQKQCIL